ncbi:MAG: endonuclease/exonuclease/phosphatase family protein [Saprospiraceae bacterium]|nr:endonuclease/exonuclease/phosphatase family protein [Saprospiraceae bacterium]
MLTSVFPAQGQPELSLISWNIRHFGASKDSAEMRFIAKVISDFDIAALQEVSAGPAGAQAVARLADELNRSGQKWDYALSDPTRSSPYKSERYAVLWKTSKVRRCGRPALLYALDSLVQREPFQVCLQCGEKRLLLLNYHASAPDDYPEREIRHIVQSMLQLDGAPLLLAGDFNLPDAHPVFFPLAKKGYRAALQSTPTTLRQSLPKPGQSAYLHPYDNVFFPANNFTMLESGRIDMVELAGSLEAALRISDHAPVWAKLRL